MPLAVFTNRPIKFWLKVANLSIPVAMQMFLQSFMGMADVVMVGSLGEAAIAAVGLSAKLHFLLLVIMTGIATAASILIAQYFGANKSDKYLGILVIALVTGLLAMVPWVVLFGWYADVWVTWINPDKVVVNFANQYLAITAPVLIFAQIIVIYEASLRALGNTKLPLMAAIVAAALNVLLNYLLIFGHWGFPQLGVAGAAWATLISRGVQLLVVVGWIYLSGHQFVIRRQDIKIFNQPTQVKKYLRIAIPLIFNYGMWAIGNTTYHVVMGYTSTDALAIMGALVPIETAFFAFFVGLANASAVLIGRALGQDLFDEAWKLYKLFLHFSISLLLLFIALVWIFKTHIILMFGRFDAVATQMLIHTLSIFCILIWLKVLNMLRIIGVLRAGGDIKFCLIMDITVMWVFGIPIYLLATFVFKWPFLILYTLIYFEEILKFIAVTKRITVKKWMQNLTLDG